MCGVPCVSSSTYGSTRSFEYSHASSTVSSVDSIMSDKRRNMTDSSNSLAICSKTFHRLCKQRIHLSWKSRSLLSCVILLGSLHADVSARISQVSHAFCRFHTQQDCPLESPVNVGYILKEVFQEEHRGFDVLGGGHGFLADIRGEMLIFQVRPQLYEKYDSVASWVCGLSFWAAIVFSDNTLQHGCCLYVRVVILWLTRLKVVVQRIHTDHYE